eukprot:gene49294-66059_t
MDSGKPGCECDALDEDGICPRARPRRGKNLPIQVQPASGLVPMGKRLMHGYPDIPFQIFALQQMMKSDHKRIRSTFSRGCARQCLWNGNGMVFKLRMSGRLAMAIAGRPLMALAFLAVFMVLRLLPDAGADGLRHSRDLIMKPERDFAASSHVHRLLPDRAHVLPES